MVIYKGIRRNDPFSCIPVIELSNTEGKNSGRTFMKMINHKISMIEVQLRWTTRYGQTQINYTILRPSVNI